MKLEKLLETEARFKYYELCEDAKVKIYDTTLRDGAQSRDVNFSVHDKLELVKALDDYGTDYIELGWPGANEDETRVFQKARKLKLKNARIVAFGSTRKLNTTAAKDCNLRNLVKSGAKIACIFGKTWVEHVEKQLKGTPEQNLESVEDSIKYLRKKGMQVFFDAEHFFDGYKDNKEYALHVLKTAYRAGASCLVLCDTRGKTVTKELRKIVAEVQNYMGKNKINVELGIHCHNDSGLAAANTLEAVDFGIKHVQVTVNGFGERAGNADLCTVVPDLVLKYKKKLKVKLTKTKKLSDLAYALANTRKNPRQPFVGENAYYHEGGAHVDAIAKIGFHAYEHEKPELVGNERHIGLSNLAGRANIAEFARSIGRKINKKDPRAALMLKKVEKMYSEGYDLTLPAERMLLYNRFFGKKKSLFSVSSWKVLTGMDNGAEYSECIMSGRANGTELDVVAKVPDGGPVDALFHALLKLVSGRYRKAGQVRLVNYKVRIAKDKGVESAVNVFIEYANNRDRWATEGISTNILEASLISIMKGFEYYLMRQ
jgi:2-isopropylmalate synthase